MESFSEAPSRSSFISLPVHQSQTPTSFYSGPPVLYFTGTGRLLVRKEDAAQFLLIEGFTKDSQTDEDSWLVDEVEVWVSSEKFLLWRPSTSAGLSITYPSIALHAQGMIPEPGNPAVQIQALYLMVILENGDDNESQDSAVSLNFIPQSSHPESSNTESSSESTLQVSVSQKLYDAISACADLHPDPDSQPSSNDGAEADEDTERPAFDYEVNEEDGMPPPFPGSSGWITSANVHQFYDEEGNWRGAGLGPGAGLVRGREEGSPQVNGRSEDDDDDESTKWRRTE